MNDELLDVYVTGSNYLDLRSCRVTELNDLMIVYWLIQRYLTMKHFTSHNVRGSTTRLASVLPPVS